MKRLIVLVILLIVFLFGSGHVSRLVVMVEQPDGTMREIASTVVSCRDPPPITTQATFGTAQDCRSACAEPGRDGTYRFNVGIVPALACSGPRGESIGLDGTGTLGDAGAVMFCTDDTCVRRLDYCDCFEPNVTIEGSDAWYSEPVNITVRAQDNHDIDRLETSAGVIMCEGAACETNETLPIGTVCSESGAGACTLRAAAYDAWNLEGLSVEAYNVDLNPPELTYRWLADGYWQRDRIGVMFDASEPSSESGVRAIYIETRTEPGCSEPGSNYTRISGARAERSLENVDGPIAFCAYATDRAEPANRGPIIRTGDRRIDTDAPIIRAEPAAQAFDTPVNVTVSCTDDGSGCRQLRAGLVNDTCPAPIALSAERTRFEADCEAGSACTYSLCAWASDGVGHASTFEAPVLIDRSEPVIRLTSLEREDGMAHVTIVISDTGSGLASCFVRSSDAEYPCEASGTLTELEIPIECGEACPLRIEARDALGNEAVIDRIIDGDAFI